MIKKIRIFGEDTAPVFLTTQGWTIHSKLYDAIKSLFLILYQKKRDDI